MEENLRILLSAYEEEKNALKELLKQDLSEEEYLMAYYHKEALHRTDREIQILKGIDNPFADNISHCYSTARSYEIMLEGAKLMSHPTEGIYRMISHYKEQARQFEELTKQVKQRTPLNIIHHGFNQLFQRKIGYFIIYLNRETGLSIKLTCTNKKLLVVMPDIKKLQKAWIISHREIEAMERMDFRLSGKGNKLTRIIHGSSEQILSAFDFLISKIVFDIFYGKRSEDKGAVEFGPPVSKRKIE